MNRLKLFAAVWFALLAPLAIAQQRPAITGVAFPRFYTSDAAAAQRFYGDTLGYERHEVNGVWEYPVNSSQWIEIVPNAGPKPVDKLAALAFTTRDAAGLERYLAAKGFKAEQPLKGGTFGVRDPEGNLILFVQAGSNALVAAARPSPHATSKRIIHVGFLVKSRTAENRFFVETLGFKPYWYGGKVGAPNEVDYVSLQVPEGSDWLEYMLNVQQPSDLATHGMFNHFSLGIADMHSVIVGLQKNHCDTADCITMKLGVDGKIQLNLFDHDHTRVEYMEFKAVAKPCCSAFTSKDPTDVEDK